MISWVVSAVRDRTWPERVINFVLKQCPDELPHSVKAAAVTAAATAADLTVAAKSHHGLLLDTMSSSCLSFCFPATQMSGLKF